MGLLFYCMMNSACALGTNLAKWRTELVKITFQGKKNFFFSCCTESFFLGKSDDGKATSFEGEKMLSLDHLQTTKEHRLASTC